MGLLNLAVDVTARWLIKAQQRADLSRQIRQAASRKRRLIWDLVELGGIFPRTEPGARQDEQIQRLWGAIGEEDATIQMLCEQRDKI